MERLSLNIFIQTDLLIRWQVDQVAPGSDRIIYVLTAVCTDNLSPLMVIFKFRSELRSLLKTATSHQHSDDEAVCQQTTC